MRPAPSALPRRHRPVHEWAEAAITLATEQGFANLSALGMMLARLGCGEQARARRHCESARVWLRAATGAGLFVPYFRGPTGRASGDWPGKRGCSALQEALALVESIDERFVEAEAASPARASRCSGSADPTVHGGTLFQSGPQLPGASRPSHWNCVPP